MIVVTGAAGFIGSNLVRALNARGRSDLLLVDDLTDGQKFRNLVDCEFLDFVDKQSFLARIASGELGAVDALFHQGACSNTMEWNGQRMLADNYEYSKALYAFATARGIPLIYASSASVYGMGPVFREDPALEKPLNLYAWSKVLFDRWVRSHASSARSQVVGLRYFNVYGPREAHKGEMASVAWKNHLQLRDGGAGVRLFESSDGYGPGEQRRDFVYVDDVVAVNLWFLDHPRASGIFNVGTGRAQTFNDVARAVIAHHGRGRIEYVPFPPGLRGSYQSNTQADISALRASGCDVPFLTVEQGVSRYLKEVGS